MNTKEIYTNLINVQGSFLRQYDTLEPVRGIFAEHSDAIPPLIPYIATDSRYIVFYSHPENYLKGFYTYANKRWEAIASVGVWLNGEVVTVQSVLRHSPIIKPTTYPIEFTYGDFGITLDITEATVKQGTMLVNITSINKFVEDRAVGSEPIEVTLKGVLNKGDAEGFINALKDPAVKFEQPLIISNLISINAIVKEFKVTQTKENENQEFEVTFTEIRE